MEVMFVLPKYFPDPIGGYRIVYQYANFLAAEGHKVTVVLPRDLEGSGSKGVFEFIKRKLWAQKIRLKHRPLVDWQWIDPRVDLRLVATVDSSRLPSADVVVATAWQTAGPVLALPPKHGAKFYLIQGYETWAGPKAAVDATWRAPLHLLVISRWLYEVGVSLGVQSLRHIPNALEHDRFKVLTPPAHRPPHIVSLYHRAPSKGVPDALTVLTRFHDLHPGVPVTMFGTPPRGPDIPSWIRYIQNPPQDVLVRDIYNQGTVYLSANLAEGWALPPAEAMACGCAFVGTDSGGCRDYAEDGVTALLSPPGDHEALLRNLCRLMDDPLLCAAIQRAGTASIQHFTWERSGRMMEAAFEAVIKPACG